MYQLSGLSKTANLHSSTDIKNLVSNQLTKTFLQTGLVGGLPEKTASYRIWETVLSSAQVFLYLISDISFEIREVAQSVMKLPTKSTCNLRNLNATAHEMQVKELPTSTGIGMSRKHIWDSTLRQLTSMLSWTSYRTGALHAFLVAANLPL